MPNSPTLLQTACSQPACPAIDIHLLHLLHLPPCHFQFTNPPPTCGVPPSLPTHGHSPTSPTSPTPLPLPVHQPSSNHRETNQPAHLLDLHLLHLPFLATRGRLGRQAIGFTYPTWQHVAGWVGKVGEAGNGSMTSSWQQEADWVGKVGEVGNGVRRRRAAGNTRQTG